MPYKRTPLLPKDSSDEEKLAYFKQQAIEAVRDQMTWLGLLIGVLLAVAGFLGYERILSKAEADAVKGLQTRIHDEVQTDLQQKFPAADVRKRIVESSAQELAGDVKERMSALLDGSDQQRYDQRYVMVNHGYVLHNILANRNLDVKGRGENQGLLGETYAVAASTQTWSLNNP